MVNFGFPLVSSTFSRTTQSLSRDVIMGNVRRLQEGLILLEEQISSGIRLLRPSIDPIATHRVLDYDNRIAKNTRFLGSLERVTGRLDMADVVAEDAITIAGKARDILLEQVQGTATPQTRLVAAGQVNEFLRQAIDMANTRFEGRYLFGGTATDAPPITTVGGAVALQANVLESFFHAGEELQVRENVTTDEIFGVLSDEIRGLQLPQQTPIDLNPDLTAATRVEDLFRGQGVPLGSITVTSTVGIGTATIDLSPAKTVGDLLALVNAEFATTGVTAAIDPAGVAVRLTSGGLITVADVTGGVTAQRLGIVAAAAASPVTGNDLDAAVTERTTLSVLASGAGIDPAGIRITNAYGSTVYSATIATPAALTVGEFVTQINESSAYVFARINDEKTGISVYSRLSGGRMRILENGGATASGVGLLYSTPRSKLVDLNGGMGLGSVEGDDLRITLSTGVELLVDVDDLTTVQDLVDRLDALPNVSATLGAGNQLIIADLTGGPFTIEDINGSYAATNLGIEQTSAGATITGAALSGAGVQVEGLFTALIRLRDALAANDTDEISNARRLVGIAEERAVSGRAGIGARGEALQFTKNRLELENDELDRVRSIDRDLDLAEAASQFQSETAVLQAALLVASRVLQVSLLNYL